MECETVREVLSARLDGEGSDLPDDLVDRHVNGCRACTAWNDELASLHRLVRVREAESVPDLSAAILEAHTSVARERRRARSGSRGAVLGEPVGAARWALFVVALTQLVLAGPALLGDDPGATVHVSRELGSFDIALAVGLLVAAWQPGRAWGLLPVATALAFVMAGTAVVDLVDGRTDSLAESHHLLDLAGVALLWLVARGAREAPRAVTMGSAAPT